MHSLSKSLLTCISHINNNWEEKTRLIYTHVFAFNTLLFSFYHCFHFSQQNIFHIIRYQMICKTTRLNKYYSHFTVDPLCKIPGVLHLHTSSISFPHFLSFICTQFCISFTHFYHTVKLVLSSHSDKNGLKYKYELNANRKYCRMLQESILQYFGPALRDNLS